MSTSRDLYEQIVRDEQELVLDRFTKADAWELGSRMREAAVARGLPIVIGIVVGQQVVFRAALDGSSADNDGWLERKTAVALRYGRSSLGVGESFRVKGQEFETHSRLDPARYAAHGGVLPLTVEGVGVVGAVGVSGLPQLEDHAFVVDQLRAFITARP